MKLFCVAICELNSLQNLGEENCTFELTPEQLEGCPADFIAARPKIDSGLVIIDLKVCCLSFFDLNVLCIFYWIVYLVLLF